ATIAPAVADPGVGAAAVLTTVLAAVTGVAAAVRAPILTAVGAAIRPAVLPGIRLARILARVGRPSVTRLVVAPLVLRLLPSQQRQLEVVARRLEGGIHLERLPPGADRLLLLAQGGERVAEVVVVARLERIAGAGERALVGLPGVVGAAQ